MSDALNKVYEAIDREHANESAHTRRKVIAGAASTIGALGLLGVPNALAFGRGPFVHPPLFHPPFVRPPFGRRQPDNSPETILTVAATAEVLATIINTLAPTKVPGGFDAVTTRNLQAAAREELIHYNVLTGVLGATPLTKTVYIPDSVFASPASLLNTVIVGDQIFINAYLIATTVFGDAGNGKNARIAAEFMGTEAVHRAVARQSLGLLGNDRAFVKYDQVETAPGPKQGLPGFTDILVAVQQLEAAGIGFGKPSPNAKGPQTAYNFDDISKLTPDPADVNTRTPA